MEDPKFRLWYRNLFELIMIQESWKTLKITLPGGNSIDLHLWLQFWGRKTEKGSWNCQKAFYRYTQVDAVILISYHDNINIWYVLTRKYRSHTSSTRHMTVFGWASSRGKEIPQDSESHKWEFHAQNFTMQGHVGKTFPRSQYTLKVLEIWYQKQLFEMLMDGSHKKTVKIHRLQIDSCMILMSCHLARAKSPWLHLKQTPAQTTERECQGAKNSRREPVLNWSLWFQKDWAKNRSFTGSFMLIRSCDDEPCIKMNVRSVPSTVVKQRGNRSLQEISTDESNPVD